MNAAEGYNARREDDRPVSGNARWPASNSNENSGWPAEDVDLLRRELQLLGKVPETTVEVQR